MAAPMVALAGGLAFFGVLTWGTPRSAWAFIAALALGCLAGLQVAIREHFSGDKPHGAILGGAIGLTVSTGAMLAGVHPTVASVAGLAAFAVAVVWLHVSFVRAAGEDR